MATDIFEQQGALTMAPGTTGVGGNVFPALDGATVEANMREAHELARMRMEGERIASDLNPLSNVVRADGGDEAALREVGGDVHYAYLVDPRSKANPETRNENIGMEVARYAGVNEWELYQRMAFHHGLRESQEGWTRHDYARRVGEIWQEDESKRQEDEENRYQEMQWRSEHVRRVLPAYLSGAATREATNAAAKTGERADGTADEYELTADTEGMIWDVNPDFAVACQEVRQLMQQHFGDMREGGRYGKVADFMAALDASREVLEEYIGEDAQKAELCYQALMGLGEAWAKTRGADAGDEFREQLSQKLDNWKNLGESIGGWDNAAAVQGGALIGLSKEDRDDMLKGMYSRVEAYRAGAPARQMLAAARDRAMEVESAGPWEAMFREYAKMGGQTLPYLIPYVGVYLGTADMMVSGATRDLDRAIAAYRWEGNPEGYESEGAAFNDVMVRAGLGALTEAGAGRVAGRAAGMGWKGLSRVGGHGLLSSMRSAAMAGGANSLSGIARRASVWGSKSFMRGFGLETGAAVLDEGLIEPVTQGLLEYGADRVMDLLGVEHGADKAFLDNFDELRQIWGDGASATALLLFCSTINAGHGWNIYGNVRWFSKNLDNIMATGVTRATAEEAMGIKDIDARNEFLAERRQAEYTDDPEGFAKRMLEANRELAAAGKVLALTGKVDDAEVNPNGALSRAYEAAWNEMEVRGLVPHVERVEDGKFHITDKRANVDVTVDERTADVYLKKAVSDAEAQYCRQMREKLDVRRRIVTDAGLIAGEAAKRAVRENGEGEGVKVVDITDLMPEGLAEKVRQKGRVDEEVMQDFLEYTRGMLEGVSGEADEAVVSRWKAAGIADSVGGLAEFAGQLLTMWGVRVGMAGAESGVAGTGAFRVRRMDGPVVVRGGEMLGTVMLTVPGGATSTNILEEVTESFLDQLVQEMVSRGGEGTPEERTAAAWRQVADVVSKVREHVLAVDPKAEVEEVDGSPLSVREAFSTLAMSDYLGGAHVPAWMRAIQSAARGLVTSATALEGVRAAMAVARAKAPDVFERFTEMLEGVGERVQTVFERARVEEQDAQAWRAAVSAAELRAQGPGGVGGESVSRAVAEAREEEQAIREGERVQPVERTETAGEAAEHVRTVLETHAAGSAGDAGLPERVRKCFAGGHCVHNESGNYYMGLVSKTAIKEGDIEQVKVGAKGKHGVIAGRELTGDFEPTAAPLFLWLRKNGELQLISGRHRFAKLMEDGAVTDHPCYVFVEGESFAGVTFDERWARMMDFENNMRDDQADEVTAAIYARETGYSDEYMRKKGLLRNGSKAKRGIYIGRQAGDELFTRVRNGAVSPMDAEIICRLTAPIKDRTRVADIQVTCCTLLEQKKSWEYIGGMAQLLANKEAVTLKQGLLDLGADFEADMDRMAKFVERNLQSLAEAIGVLKGDRKLAKKGGKATRLGVSAQLSEDEREQRIADLERIKSDFEFIGSNPDLIAQAQLWDGKTEIDPVARYLEQAAAQREQEARESGMDAGEYLEEQAAKQAAAEAVPSLFGSMSVVNEEELASIRAAAIEAGTFMKAPNGADTNLTERQWLLVRTRAFKAWFGDWENDPEHASKVLDENGEPLVVYHGSRTPRKFTKFDGYGFFIDNKKVAEMFRNEAAYIMIVDGEEYPVSREEVARLSELTGDYVDPDDFVTFGDLVEEGILTPERLQEGADSGEIQIGVSDWSGVKSLQLEKPDGGLYECFLNIRKPYKKDYGGRGWTDDADLIGDRRKFDGSIITNIREGGALAEIDGEDVPPATDYIAYSPNQIKSATANRGTFDGGNADITFSLIMGERGAARLTEAVEVLGNLRTARGILGRRKWHKLTRQEQVKIKLATGWEQDAEGHWVMEAPDLNQVFPEPDVRFMDAAERAYQEHCEAAEEATRIWEERKGKDLTAAERKRYDDARRRSDDAWREYKRQRERYRKSGLPKGPLKMEDFIKGTPYDEAYPELKGIKVECRVLRGCAGYFSPLENAIYIDKDCVEPRVKLGIALHEVQHVIQDIEGWGKGGDASLLGKENYRRLTGEVAARNAERRTYMPVGERNLLGELGEYQALLEDTEDVARENQLVRDSHNTLRGGLQAVGDLRMSFSKADAEESRWLGHFSKEMHKMARGGDATLHNEGFGTVLFEYGNSKHGALHFRKQRTAQGFSLEDTARIAVLAGCAVEKGTPKMTESKDPAKRQFDMYGVRAIVGIHGNATVITGYEILELTDEQKKKEKRQKEKRADAVDDARRPRQGYAVQDLGHHPEWGAALKKAIAWFEGVVKQNSKKDAEKIFETFSEMMRIKHLNIIEERFMKAPNGADTNLTERQWLLVRTRAFKDWFGDWEKDPEHASKVLDENGEPLVVWHGTPEKFNVFDRTKTRANMDIQGNFFTPWKLDAQGYGENVRSFFLNIRKPAKFGQGYAALNEFKGQNEAGVKARELLVSQGYDGVDSGDEYIAFEPEQIKSATKNRWLFDGGSGDVTMSRQDAEVATERALRILEGRPEERYARELAGEFRKRVERFSLLALGEPGEGSRKGRGAKFYGELMGLVDSARLVLGEAAHVGRLSGLLAWCRVYAGMMQEGKAPEGGELKGGLYSEFVARMKKMAEGGRLNGLKADEVEEMMAQYAGERLDVAMDKVLRHVVRSLDDFVKARARERMDYLRETCYPKREEGRKWPRGKMSADSYRRVERIYQMMEMDAERVATRIESVKRELAEVQGEDEQDEGRRAKEEELEDELALLSLYGCWEMKGAQEAARAAESFAQEVLYGRREWTERLRAERRRLAWQRQEIEGHFKTPESELLARSARRNAKEGASDVRIGMTTMGGFKSFAHLLKGLEKHFGQRWTIGMRHGLADIHVGIERFLGDLGTWLLTNVRDITGLQSEGDIQDWLTSCHEFYDTGITLEVDKPGSKLTLSPAEAYAWLRMTPDEREAKRAEMRRAAETMEELPDNIPTEEQLVEMRHKVGSSYVAKTQRGQELLAAAVREAREEKVRVALAERESDLGRMLTRDETQEVRRTAGQLSKEEWTEVRDRVIAELSLTEELEAEHVAAGAPQYWVLPAKEKAPRRLETTKMALLQAVLTFEQPDYEHLMEPNGVTPAILWEMKKQIGPKLLELGYRMREKLNENGQDMAEVYERLTGIPFGARANYFRGIFDVNKAQQFGEAVDSEGGSGMPSGKHGMLIPRRYHKCRLPWESNLSALSVFLEAMKAQNRYTLTAEYLHDARGLMQDRDFMQKCRAEVGASTMSLVTDWLHLIEGSELANTRQVNFARKLIGKVTRGMAVSYLAGNVGTYIKQATAIVNSFLGGFIPEKVEVRDGRTRVLAERGIGVGEWLASAARVVAGRGKARGKELAGDDMFRYRAKAEGADTMGAAQLPANRKVGTRAGRVGKKVADALMYPIYGLDIMFNRGGAAVLYDATYRALEAKDEQGLLTPEQKDRVCRDTIRQMLDYAAQPVLKTQMSFHAAARTASAVGEGLFLFRSESLKNIGAVMGLVQSGDWRRAAAGFLFLGVGYAAALQLIDALKGYGPDDDDEDKWAKVATKFTLDALTGDLTSIPVVDSLVLEARGGVEAAIGAATGAKVGTPQWRSQGAIGTVKGAIKSEARNVDDGAPMRKHVAAVSRMLKGLGVMSSFCQNSAVGPISDVASLAWALAACGNLGKWVEDIYETVAGDEGE